VELKGKIKLATWVHVVRQFEGMFLSSVAVSRLLEVQRIVRVTCYVAGTEDRISNESKSASPTLLKTPVGGARTFGDFESWNEALVELPLSFKANLIKGWKNSMGVVDFGSI
jgi:hypothetical protein